MAVGRMLKEGYGCKQNQQEGEKWIIRARELSSERG